MDGVYGILGSGEERIEICCWNTCMKENTWVWLGFDGKGTVKINPKFTGKACLAAGLYVRAITSDCIANRQTERLLRGCLRLEWEGPGGGGVFWT
jgi:hypothetical protein